MIKMALQYRRAPSPGDFKTISSPRSGSDAADDMRDCPECDQQVSGFAWQCPHCGYYLHGEGGDRKQPWWWVAVLIICIILVLVTILYWPPMGQ
jgi:uncharacterized paraquat-inducible protein A